MEAPVAPEEKTPEKLREKTARFYARYEPELIQIKNLIEAKLSQICLAYAIENKLPAESFQVIGRVKSIKSFIDKLERKGWPYFNKPTELITDLVGVRIICWFVDDCYGLLDFIKTSKQMDIDMHTLRDYIKNPKNGYRALHVLAQTSYDRIKNDNGNMVVVDDKLTCEIQIRTKFQDALSVIVHQFYYGSPETGEKSTALERHLSDISNELYKADKKIMVLRPEHQKLADDATKSKKRQGFDASTTVDSIV